MKQHLRAMRAAERAIARATELYAQQGHEELFRKCAALLPDANLAIEVIETTILAAEHLEAERRRDREIAE